MSIFAGPGVSSWPLNNPIGIDWINTAPLFGRANYPVIIDIVEEICSVYKNKKANEFALAMAPYWEDLKISPPLLLWGEVNEEDSNVNEMFLLRYLIEILNSVPRNYGLILRNPEYWDKTSIKLFYMIVDMAKNDSFCLAVETEGEFLQQLIDRVPSVRLIKAENRRIRTIGRKESEIIKYISLCRHGLPIYVLENLNLNVNILPIELFYDFSSGIRRACLNIEDYRRLHSGVSQEKESRKTLSSEIFLFWKSGGHDYIRKASYGLYSGKIDDILSYHHIYLEAMRSIGQGFRYDHLSTLADHLRVQRQPELELSCRIGAGRLAKWQNDGFRLAVKHYNRALSLSEIQPISQIQRASLMSEIANLYSNQSERLYVDKGAELFSQVFRLSRVLDGDDQIRIMVRALNGLALTKYRLNDPLAAIELEDQALEIALGCSKSFPETSHWARLLLRSNKAKVYEKKLHDFPQAICLLEENLKEANQLNLSEISINLARICFKNRDYVKCQKILDGIYKNRHTSDPLLDHYKDIAGRVLYIAVLIINDHNHDAMEQTGKLNDLIKFFNLSGMDPIFKLIKNHLNDVIPVDQ